MRIDFNEETKNKECPYFENRLELLFNHDRVFIGSVDCVLGCKHNGRRSGMTFCNCESPARVKDVYKLIAEQLKEKMHG